MKYDGSYLKSLELVVDMIETRLIPVSTHCMCKEIYYLPQHLYFVLLSTAYVFGLLLRGASVAVLFLAVSCQGQGRVSHWSFLWCCPTWAISAFGFTSFHFFFFLLHYNTVFTEYDNGINGFLSMFVFMLSNLHSVILQAEARSVFLPFSCCF